MEGYSSSMPGSTRTISRAQNLKIPGDGHPTGVANRAWAVLVRDALGCGGFGRCFYASKAWALACRRPRRRGPRHPGPESPRQPGGVAVDAQASQKARVCAEIAGTDKLRSYGSAFRQL
jgi:hypothetical protein